MVMTVDCVLLLLLFGEINFYGDSCLKLDSFTIENIFIHFTKRSSFFSV